MEVVVASDLLIDFFVAGVAGASLFSSPIQRCDVLAWPSTASGGYSCREKGGGRCGGGVGGGQRDALCQKSFDLQIDTHVIHLPLSSWSVPLSWWSLFIADGGIRHSVLESGWY